MSRANCTEREVARSAHWCAPRRRGRVSELPKLIASPAVGIPTFRHSAAVRETGGQFNKVKIADNGCRSRAGFQLPVTKLPAIVCSPAQHSARLDEAAVAAAGCNRPAIVRRADNGGSPFDSG